MKTQKDYNQQMNIKYLHQELIDVPQIIEECKVNWFNQSLTEVNDSVVRLGIVEGEYHWHKHDDEDEFFMHRPRATQKTVMLMVESNTIDPIGSTD